MRDATARQSFELDYWSELLHSWKAALQSYSKGLLSSWSFVLQFGGWNEKVMAVIEDRIKDLQLCWTIGFEEMQVRSLVLESEGWILEEVYFNRKWVESVGSRTIGFELKVWIKIFELVLQRTEISLGTDLLEHSTDIELVRICSQELCVRMKRMAKWISYSTTASHS